MKRLLLTVCLTVMMVFAAASGAQAVAITGLTYDITSDHMTGGAGTPPFGTVNLAENVTGGVDVTVTLNAGNLFLRTGAGGGGDAKYTFFFNATGVNTEDFSGTSVFDAIASGINSTPPPLGTLHADGTGYWMFGVYDPTQGLGGGDGLAGPLTFTIADATIADLTIGNELGNIFAIDIYSGQTRNTGLVDVSTPPRVPEASALLLLGTGLAGLVVWRRKKRFE